MEISTYTDVNVLLHLLCMLVNFGSLRVGGTEYTLWEILDGIFYCRRCTLKDEVVKSQGSILLKLKSINSLHPHVLLPYITHTMQTQNQ
jgi:hypothetical protein